MKLYAKEDFKGFEIQESWNSMDVLAAVASHIRKKEFPENKKLVKKNEFVGVKKQNMKKKMSNKVSGLKRKHSFSSNAEQTELPEEFKIAISEELNGGKEFTGELMLLAEKTLYKADILDSQNRLSLPLSYVKCDFLKKNEMLSLERRFENNKHGFMEVKIIEPSLVRGVVDLRIWETSCLKYVLNGKWKEIVKRNGLSVGTDVQLWGFRIDEELCFALRKLPKGETSSPDQSETSFSVNS